MGLVRRVDRSPSLARALQAQGKSGEARSSAAAALEHLEPSMGADNPETREAREIAVGTEGPAVAATAR